MLRHWCLRKQIDLISYTWWTSKVQCYVYMSALVSLHVGKPTWISRMQYPFPVMTTWSRCMRVFRPWAKSPFSVQYVCYVMVVLFSRELLGHGLVCTPPLCLPLSLAANPFLLSAFTELYAMSKANMLWRHTKFMQIPFMWRDFTCLCCYDVAHSVFVL